MGGALALLKSSLTSDENSDENSDEPDYDGGGVSTLEEQLDKRENHTDTKSEEGEYAETHNSNLERSGRNSRCPECDQVFVRDDMDRDATVPLNGRCHTCDVELEEASDDDGMDLLLRRRRLCLLLGQRRRHSAAPAG